MAGGLAPKTMPKAKAPPLPPILTELFNAGRLFGFAPASQDRLRHVRLDGEEMGLCGFAAPVACVYAYDFNRPVCEVCEAKARRLWKGWMRGVRLEGAKGLLGWSGAQTTNHIRRWSGVRGLCGVWAGATPRDGLEVCGKCERRLGKLMREKVGWEKVRETWRRKGRERKG